MKSIEKHEIYRNGFWVVSAVFVLLLGAFGLPLLAQHKDAQHKSQETLRVGKKGDITLSSSLQVGDVTLKLGKYQFQHKVEGADHVVVFNTPSGKEAARMKGGGPHELHTGAARQKGPTDGFVHQDR